MLFLLLLLPMSGLVTEAFFGSHCQDRQLKPCTRGCSWGLERYFNGVANRVLPGHGYRNLTLPSLAMCSRECLIDDRCFSFHYSEGERRCELNGATTSRYPMALIERAGTDYFGPEEVGYYQLVLCFFVSWIQGKSYRATFFLLDIFSVPISLTDCWYHTHASAASECRRTGQHLCLQWELYYASKEGYPTTPPSWYADPDSLAVLTETGVTYHDLPLTAPSPGLCCSLPMTYRDPVITPQGYELADRAGQASGCSDLAAHPCTLAELKEAYDRGYIRGFWLYFAMPNRDASVAGCTIHQGDECYQGTIANTPRPTARARVYCCPSRV
ncbi:uncharacterized protein LOC119736798 [Patiria miniata]|uniref:Apple domain-containing protein n=1 Tax=Patiria miniata TaxID=46514 RepID=A0A914ATC6_PATMI|nr:uncharacterized protein LOC119736798 [Patiria miniata]